ncbi:Tudor domaincontaining protein 7Alike [Caligus rogercresseyi]|uniref:Tudor domaincontaining protein 7Alike n=1 Tax=Caligus rogercresseyi TaxID=217165 RepID=A0A7T8GQX5_CALRO|nr:Tudor domaincontaining protein 7Alike [Caligus rogercresseyi]
MSEESDRKEVIKLIRACLLSSKGGVCLDQINRDYHDLVGENIPYRKLGHANLTDFFSKARDVCRIMESQGKILVHPWPPGQPTHRPPRQRAKEVVLGIRKREKARWRSSSSSTMASAAPPKDPPGSLPFTPTTTTPITTTLMAMAKEGIIHEEEPPTRKWAQDDSHPEAASRTPRFECPLSLNPEGE